MKEIHSLMLYILSYMFAWESSMNNVGIYLYYTPPLKTVYTSCTRNLKKFWNEGMSEGINLILKSRYWTSNLDVKKLQKLGCAAADNSIVITISTAFRTGKKRNCNWFRTGRPWGHRVWKFNYWSVHLKIPQKRGNRILTQGSHFRIHFFLIFMITDLFHQQI